MYSIYTNFSYFGGISRDGPSAGGNGCVLTDIVFATGKDNGTISIYKSAYQNTLGDANEVCGGFRLLGE